MEKTADWIWMLFGVVSGVGRGMGVLDGVEIVEEERADFGVNVRHPIVTNGDLWRSYSLPCGMATRLMPNNKLFCSVYRRFALDLHQDFSLKMRLSVFIACRIPSNHFLHGF